MLRPRPLPIAALKRPRVTLGDVGHFSVERPGHRHRSQSWSFRRRFQASRGSSPRPASDGAHFPSNMRVASRSRSGLVLTCSLQSTGVDDNRRGTAGMAKQFAPERNQHLAGIDLGHGARLFRRFDRRDVEQLPDEPSGAVNTSNNLAESLFGGFRHRARQRHLGLGFQPGKARRSQFMGGKGDKILLALTCAGDAAEQRFNARSTGRISLGVAVSIGCRSEASRVARSPAFSERCQTTPDAQPDQGRQQRYDQEGRKEQALTTSLTSLSRMRRSSLTSSARQARHFDPRGRQVSPLITVRKRPVACADSVVSGALSDLPIRVPSSDQIGKKLPV